MTQDDLLPHVHTINDLQGHLTDILKSAAAFPTPNLRAPRAVLRRYMLSDVVTKLEGLARDLGALVQAERAQLAPDEEPVPLTIVPSAP